MQQPRIPIWVVGAWPRMKSMRRALRYDGLLPTISIAEGESRPTRPDEVREMKTFVDASRTEHTPFDIVMDGETPGDVPQKATSMLREWADTGVTWWIETRWSEPRNAEGQAVALQRIRQGPPRLE